MRHRDQELFEENAVLLRIDHVVVVVQDLASAVADYQRAGFTVTPGGEHVGGDTHNALIPFGDGTYFELIAFKEPRRPQEHRWWPRLSRGEGLVDYALLSSDLDAEAARLRDNGMSFTGPVDGGRARPDGQLLAWRSIFLGKGVGGSALPFVIQDVTRRELRVPDEEATRHPNGVAGVAGLTVLVSDLAGAGAGLEELLGISWTTGESAGGRSMRFPIGQQWIELFQPNDAAGPAAEYLHRFGDSPYQVELTRGRSALPGKGASMPGNLHGALLAIGG